tara:strand:- start:527 stop:709 length:183 start_codon:yes stop_codon:yes gene_type:complete
MLFFLSLIPAGKTITHSPVIQDGVVQMKTTVKHHSNPFRTILLLLIFLTVVGFLLLVSAL